MTKTTKRAASAALCFLLLTAAAHGQQYDLLLKGGRVIDPKNSIDGMLDVAVAGGRIAAVAASINAAQARRVVDVTGLIVVPGLIDIHAHMFHTTGQADAWAGDSSIAPDSFGPRSCTTTMVDAGSSGWRNFETFRHTVLDRAKTRSLAMINIAGLGMMTDVAEQADFNPEEVARLALKHKDVVVGVKSAHYQKPDWDSVDKAIEAGTKANIPVMVDFGFFLPERPYYELVGKRLRPGDISTHCFRGPVPVVDEKGKLYKYLFDARKRGVKFDVGHGGGSFVFRNALPAVQQGFYPDSISTDLHTGSMNAGMIDMVNTMSKFMAMGMPMPELIKASTWNPANEIKRAELGHLSVGAVADIAVLRIEEGKFGLLDGFRGRLNTTKRLGCELTVRDGAVAWDWNGRAGADYQLLGPTSGNRPADVVVRPK